MRVLIVGASGFIGQYLVRRLNAIPDYAIVGTFWSRAPQDDLISWRQVELTGSAALEQVFEMAQPDVVVHLAAMADVGTAERNPQLATAVNVTATSTIAHLCQLHGARLVFVSTEYVFDGRRGYYREDEPPNPTTHYGLTKYQAEQEVAKLASLGVSSVPVSSTVGRPPASVTSSPGWSNASAAAKRTRAPPMSTGPPSTLNT